MWCVWQAEGSPRSGDGEEPQKMTAKLILAQMAETYRECTSYADLGTVISEYLAPGKFISETRFKTAFVRSDRFRYQYVDDRDKLHIVWSDHRRTLVWSDVWDEVREQQSLGQGLGGATGVSSGSSHLIPRLLLPDQVGGLMLTHMTQAVRIEDEAIGGDDCYRIQGMLNARSTILWIEIDRFVVRNIEMEYEVGNMHLRTTTSYDPVLNSNIPESDLAFDPPVEE
jgi:hypothetical protein